MVLVGKRRGKYAAAAIYNHQHIHPRAQAWCIRTILHISVPLVRQRRVLCCAKTSTMVPNILPVFPCAIWEKRRNKGFCIGAHPFKKNATPIHGGMQASLRTMTGIRSPDSHVPDATFTPIRWKNKIEFSNINRSRI